MKYLIREWWFGILLVCFIVGSLSLVVAVDRQRDEACLKAGGDIREGNHCYKVELVHVPAR